MSGLDDKTNLFHFQQRNSKQNGYLIIYLHDYLFLGGYCHASILKQKNITFRNVNVNDPYLGHSFMKTISFFAEMISI